MKFLIKKIYIIIFLLGIIFIGTKVFAKESKIKYTKENISNYFSGIISANQNNENEALKYLKKVKQLKDIHSRYNVEYIRALVLLEKFDEAFIFSKTIHKKNEFFFETNLLLGLNYFIKKKLY